MSQNVSLTSGKNLIWILRSTPFPTLSEGSLFPDIVIDALDAYPPLLVLHPTFVQRRHFLPPVRYPLITGI